MKKLVKMFWKFVKMYCVFCKVFGIFAAGFIVSECGFTREGATWFLLSVVLAVLARCTLKNINDFEEIESL